MSARLYVSIDRSGLTPRYIASPHMHPGAREWVPQETLDALRDAATLALSDLEVAFKQGTSTIELIRLGTGAGIRLRAALAALPAPPGAQEEG